MAGQTTCPKCGQTVAPNAVYCRSCGCPLENHPLRVRRLKTHLCLALWSLLATIMLVQNPLAAGAEEPVDQVMLGRIGRGVERVRTRAEAVARGLDRWIGQRPTGS
jgi:hypothetical protein